MYSLSYLAKQLYMSYKNYNIKDIKLYKNQYERR